MSIKKPVFTRYDPCGLGIIHLDKVNDQNSTWDGVIHFGLYSILDLVEIEIYFEEAVIVYSKNWASTFTVRRNSWKDLVVRHISPFPSKYVFRVQTVENNVTDVPIVSKLILNHHVLCNTDIKTSETISSFNITKTPELYKHICGRRSLPNTELVSVRTAARTGDWPWHVAIMNRNPATKENVYDCGGNIISRTTVLTAGHCIHKNDKLVEAERVTVIAGTNNHKDLGPGSQVLLAQQLIVHPAYTYTQSTSDIGIIKVNKFIYTDYVQPICLWGPGYDKATLFEKEATMVGFGATEHNVQSDVLRSSLIKVQNDSTCNAFKPTIYTSLLNEFTFCAGYGPLYADNPRNGDSGGGLVVMTVQPDHRISWFLRGIFSKCGVSPGQTKCDPTYYVIFTDVGPHYGWISHHSDILFTIHT